MANMFSKKTRTLTERASEARNMADTAVDIFESTATTLDYSADDLARVAEDAQGVVESHVAIRDAVEIESSRRREQAANIRKVVAGI